VVTMTSGTGSCAVTADQAGNGNYNAATQATASATATKINQTTLTVSGPSSITIGNTGTAAASGGNGGGAVSFSAGGSTGCSLSGTTVSVIDTTLPCSLTATKTGDNNYNSASSAAFTVTLVKRSSGTSVALQTAQVNEGTPVTVTITVSDMSGTFIPAGTVSLTAVTNLAFSSSSCTLVAGSCQVTVTPADNGTFTVTAMYSGSSYHSASSGSSTLLTVKNVAPTVTITAPASGAIYAINAPVTFTGSFTDPGILDTHTAQWLFDTTSVAGTVTETNGNGTVNTTYSFSTPGVYLVTLTVTDKDLGAGSANTVAGLTAMVVVYDPNAGFVTGGGWINSPAGAYAQDKNLTGKASFGFVSKYEKGATIPTGDTEFNFQVAKFDFHSTAYQWLVVSGPMAQYKGTGTINGAGNYNFLLTARDGDVAGGGGVDGFRIKITDPVTGNVIYDNLMSSDDTVTSANTQAIGGGSIVIHSK
jgi:PKD domain